MPVILAIDSSTEICSVAINRDGHIEQLRSKLPRQHAKETLPMVQKLLKQFRLMPADLDGIAFTRGPGSFTGLRIGGAVAQGLAFAHNIPVITISSLAVMAFTAVREHKLNRVQVALQAREGEIYLAAYTAVEAAEEISVCLQGAEQVVAISSLASALIGISDDSAGVGNAWVGGGQLRKQITPSLNGYFPEIFPEASVLSILAMQKFLAGEAVDAEHALPIYLKEQLEYK
jgi:tRNA threonylcarbamoyladenosine biosynthesis protein TsaB